jgi:hypothetical protein
VDFNHRFTGFQNSIQSSPKTFASIHRPLFLKQPMNMKVLLVAICAVMVLAPRVFAEDAFVIQTGFGVETKSIPIDLFGTGSSSSSSSSSGSSDSSSSPSVVGSQQQENSQQQPCQNCVQYYYPAQQQQQYYYPQQQQQQYYSGYQYPAYNQQYYQYPLYQQYPQYAYSY